MAAHDLETTIHHRVTPAKKLPKTTEEHKCRVCLRSFWGYKPTGGCPGVPDYYYWDSVPGTVKTKTGLKEMGLKPGGPRVAVVSYVAHKVEKSYDLFSVADAVPKKEATEAQLAALAKAQLALRTCKRCRQPAPSRDQLNRYRICCDCVAKARAKRHGRRQDEVIRWAREIMADPEKVRVLDTETTDLDGEICEIAILDGNGKTLLDTLVKPVGPMGATFIHGITEEMVAGAPTFAQLWPTIAPILRGKTVVSYNVAFDAGMVRYGIRETLAAGLVVPPFPADDPGDEIFHRLPSWVSKEAKYRLGFHFYFDQSKHLPSEVEASEFGLMCRTSEEYCELKTDYRRRRVAYDSAENAARKAANAWMDTMNWQCLMEEYAVFYGEWSSYFGSYKWQPLHGGHRAEGDARAALELLQHLANAPLRCPDEQEDEPCE